jgi:phenylpyruvate tautomerase PptA (4-oxalocrotonate tautomerase family)
LPCLEISVPKLTLANKKQLAKQLTEAFVTSTGMPAEIFGIRFYDYEIGDTANGGNLWDGSGGKPYHHFVLFGGRLQCDVKKKLIESFSRVYAECLGKSDWKPVIFICELPYDNIGVEGRPLSEPNVKFTDR